MFAEDTLNCEGLKPTRLKKCQLAICKQVQKRALKTKQWHHTPIAINALAFIIVPYHWATSVTFLYIFNNRAHWPAVLLILAPAHYKVKLSLTLMLTCTCKLKHKLKNEVQLLWKVKARFLSPSDFVMTNIRCHLRLVLNKDLIHNHNVGH